MRYVGSKARHAKHILPLMLAGRRPEQCWVEPFVGGGNVITKVEGPRLGADSNRYVVALLKAVRDGWIPPETVTESEYLTIKSSPDDYPEPMVGFVGTQCTFGSKWFDCYAKVGTKGPQRNFAREGRDNLLKQADGLKGVELVAGDYRTLSIPPNSLVYCDPPYDGTLGYAGAGAFDHHTFWDWCDSMVREGHDVFVSEYAAPPHWKCIWERETAGFQSRTERKRPVEKLFTTSRPHVSDAEEDRISDEPYGSFAAGTPATPNSTA